MQCAAVYFFYALAKVLELLELPLNHYRALAYMFPSPQYFKRFWGEATGKKPKCDLRGSARRKAAGVSYLVPYTPSLSECRL